MRRARKPDSAQRPLLPPPPTFDRREKAAHRAWRKAAYSGCTKRPRRGEFDPLELRAGLRAHCIESRWGWRTNNPGLSDVLDRRPDIDESLPGPAWLREVYRDQRYLCALPSALAVMDARIEAQRLAMECPVEALPAASERAPQTELFGATA